MSGLLDSLSMILGLLVESDAGMWISGLALVSFCFAGFYRLTAVDGD